jgi:periplasmic mercuric ion binding protein
MRRLITAAILFTATVPVYSAPKTVTLAVPTMNCPACPITIKKALTAVPGVSSAAVQYEQRQATVTFDDAKTTVEALTQATTNAGYPSTLAEDTP